MKRLDEERLETLRHWGAGLEAEERPELRAAGRAILLLLEEIELLNMDLWHARTAPAAEAQPLSDSATGGATTDVAASLRLRLRRLAGAEQAPPPIA